MVRGLTPAERRLTWMILAAAALGLVWNTVGELQPPPPPVTLLRGVLAPDSTGAPPLNDAPGSDVYGDVRTVPAGPVDLRTADAAELETLPGIGPVLARRIMAWRSERNGPWTVEDLLDVSGIGPVKLELFRPFATVGDPPDGGAGGGR